MDESTGRKVCGLIVGMVITDGELTGEENAFVGRLMARFGIKHSDDVLIRPVASGAKAAEILKKLPAQVQQEAFELLIQAAAADGKIVAAERTYLDAVAAVVGSSAERLEERLADALAAADTD